MTAALNAESCDATDSARIQRITDAANTLRIAKALGHPDPIEAAHDDLHDAVLTANDAGISWQIIGEVFDIARGNAYQRYRRKAQDVERKP